MTQINIPEMIYAYDIMWCDPNTGKMMFDELDGVSNDHAYEEATYECPGEIIRVTRGEPRGYTT